MSNFWKQLCQLLMAILEELINLEPSQDHTVVAKAGLSAAKNMIEKENGNAKG